MGSWLDLDVKNVLAIGSIEFITVFLGIALSLWEDEYRENNETPEFPEGTYYYFITNEFPGVSR